MFPVFSADLNLWTLRFIFRILILFKRWSIGHSRCLRSKWVRHVEVGVPKLGIDFNKRGSYTYHTYAPQSLDKAFGIRTYNNSTATTLFLSNIILFNSLFGVTCLAGMGLLHLCLFGIHGYLPMGWLQYGHPMLCRLETATEGPPIRMTGHGNKLQKRMSIVHHRFILFLS